MPQFPDSLDPTKGRKERRVEIEWQTISYRTVAMVVAVVFLAAGATVYLLYPEKVQALMKRLVPSGPGVKEGSLQRQAQFLNIDGNVRVKKANAVGWVAASPDLPLEKGDVVQASGDGLARISFADGTVYTVRPETLITIEDNAASADNKTSVAVQVSVGEVDLTTTKFEGVSRVSFGGGGMARVGQDSRAKVKNDPKSQTSEITVGQGSAEVVRGSDRVTLGSYEKVSFRHDASAMLREKYVGAPLPLTPANGAPVIAEDTGRTEVTFTWTLVPTAKQYRLRISTSPIFTTLAYDKRVASSSVTVQGLAENTYYWAVASVDDKNEESQPSDASKFILQKTGRDQILLEIDRLVQHGRTVQVEGRVEPGARVMINNEPVYTVQPDGSFKHFTQAFASSGANQITVTAQNAKGQITTRRKTVYIQ